MIRGGRCRLTVAGRNKRQLEDEGTATSGAVQVAIYISSVWGIEGRPLGRVLRCAPTRPEPGHLLTSRAEIAAALVALSSASRPAAGEPPAGLSLSPSGTALGCASKLPDHYDAGTGRVGAQCHPNHASVGRGAGCGVYARVFH
jgi:hypothetical protein